MPPVNPVAARRLGRVHRICRRGSCPTSRRRKGRVPRKGNTPPPGPPAPLAPHNGVSEAVLTAAAAAAAAATVAIAPRTAGLRAAEPAPPVVHEDRLDHRRHRHREQRADEAVAVLAHDQREDHEHRVDLRRVADDLRVEEVRLDQVDADDPPARSSPCLRSNVPDEISAIATIGTDDRIDPKIGIRLIVAAITARISGYLTWKMSRPTYVKTPLMKQISSWPRITPDRPRSMPAMMRRSRAGRSRVPASARTPGCAEDRPG